MWFDRVGQGGTDVTRGASCWIGCWVSTCSRRRDVFGPIHCFGSYALKYEITLDVKHTRADAQLVEEPIGMGESPLSLIALIIPCSVFRSKFEAH